MAHSQLLQARELLQGRGQDCRSLRRQMIGCHVPADTAQECLQQPVSQPGKHGHLQMQQASQPLQSRSQRFHASRTHATLQQIQAGEPWHQLQGKAQGCCPFFFKSIVSQVSAGTVQHSS